MHGFSSRLLEVKCGGKSSLKISVQLTTGQLLLRPGASVQDSGEVANHIRLVPPPPPLPDLEPQIL